jgi:hypothetical protein
MSSFALSFVVLFENDTPVASTLLGEMWRHGKYANYDTYGDSIKQVFIQHREALADWLLSLVLWKCSGCIVSSCSIGKRTELPSLWHFVLQEAELERASRLPRDAAPASASSM